ncbi:MAG: Crp/Fnr family transcriptional regulator [Parasphingopyxis sp.]
MSNSCFATRLSHFLALTPAEEAALARLEDKERQFERGECIRHQGDPADELFIVRKGWLYSHLELDDGKRQILRINFPGDLVGTSSVAFGNASHSLTALSDGVLCPFDRRALAELFEQHSRLATLLFLISQAERVAMDDRLASLGRTDAKARIAALLLDIVVRHRIMGDGDLAEVEIPMTQEDIGDATGLTSVHVNRMMKELKRDGLILRERNRVTILDEGRLVDLAGYINRYAAVDTSWLPALEA